MNRAKHPTAFNRKRKCVHPVISCSYVNYYLSLMPHIRYCGPQPRIPRTNGSKVEIGPNKHERLDSNPLSFIIVTLAGYVCIDGRIWLIVNHAPIGALLLVQACVFQGIDDV